MNPRFGPAHFYGLLALGGALVLIGLGSAHFMEEHGHVVTGMNNQVVWGLPHVFAIFMIVAASGVLNVASIGSVFGQPVYKPRAPLSGLLCVAMLAGGLMVLMLDLGRPERLIVAATHYNPSSVFAWNVLLYSGMFAIVALYLWTMFERSMNRYSKSAGLLALVWRFVLTTGTGSIFGFLVARQAYASAVLAPLFIVLSFGWGLAVFLLVQSAMYAWNGQTLDPAVQRRMARLLGAVRRRLVLPGGGVPPDQPVLRAPGRVRGLHPSRWAASSRCCCGAGYALAGTALPLLLLFHPRLGGPRATQAAALLVVLGAFAWLYVFIIGGQAFPLEIFPGYSASSSFGDGAMAHYVPRWPEWLLGLGGVGAAFVLTTIGVRVLDFMPQDDFVALKTGAKGVA